MSKAGLIKKSAVAVQAALTATIYGIAFLLHG